MKTKKLLSLLVLPLALTSCAGNSITVKQALEILENVDREAAINFVTTIDEEASIKTPEESGSTKTIVDFTTGSRYFYYKLTSQVSVETAVYEESGKYYSCMTMLGCTETDKEAFDKVFSQIDKEVLIDASLKGASDAINNTLADYVELSNDEVASKIKEEIEAEYDLESKAFSFSLTSPDSGIELSIKNTYISDKDYKASIHVLINKYGLPVINELIDEMSGTSVSSITTYNKAVTRVKF